MLITQIEKNRMQFNLSIKFKTREIIVRSPSIQLYFSLCLSKPFLNADVSRNHVNYMTASIFVEKVKFSISFCFKVDLIQTKFYFNHASIFADVRIIFLSNLAIIDWFVGL